MSESRDIVSVLDDAKQTGDFDELHRLLRSYFLSEAENKSEIVQEALIEISNKMRKGVPHPLLADELRGILRICIKRVRSRKYMAHARLALSDDEQFRDVLIDAGADPALVLERRQAVDDRIVALTEMKKKNPRQFAALQAAYLKKNVSEHFENVLSEQITSENSRKLLERGRKAYGKELERIQKDAPK